MGTLIDYKRVLEGHLKWSEAKKILGEPVPLGLWSPFGNVCFAQLALILVFGLVFIFQQIYFCEVCSRLKRKTNVRLFQQKVAVAKKRESRKVIFALHRRAPVQQCNDII